MSVEGWVRFVSTREERDTQIPAPHNDQQVAPDGGCKHFRRVDHESEHGQVPRPDVRLPEWANQFNQRTYAESEYVG